MVTPEVESILSQHRDRVLPLTRGRNVTVAELPGLTGARHPEAARAGLALLLGDWEQAHEISQNVETAEGSYWHGIVHRMEPDASNAAYWFRRVGAHAVYPALHARAAAILAETGSAWKLGKQWEAARLIDWCEEARRKPAVAGTALAIQRAEWDLLFEWCAA